MMFELYFVNRTRGGIAEWMNSVAGHHTQGHGFQSQQRKNKQINKVMSSDFINSDFVCLFVSQSVNQSKRVYRAICRE